MAKALREVDAGFELYTWQKAVVLGLDEDSARIGLESGEQAVMPLDSMTWARQEFDADHLGPAIRRRATL